MSKKLKAVIIGPGRPLRQKAGTDLLMTMQRCEWVKPATADTHQSIL
ncbi:hypothetical protein [Marinobacterium rhizophilum]|uniref:Uncharacterized protein n=1 Tax=Marinobacterium rhizophilum TaxID=420402 RepID=A0ABY5HQ20_9GAMM|nr:hypothetical protein [Marinobacterium rhizophilum]UTW14505.1 hypothetical protein KDW95_00765 [Marinobacterium rhizophilum]